MTPFWPGGDAIQVQLQGGKPVAFRWRHRLHRVRKVSACWRVHTRWWTEAEICRDYWEIATDDSFLCVIYQDLSAGAWYLERVFE